MISFRPFQGWQLRYGIKGKWIGAGARPSNHYLQISYIIEGFSRSSFLLLANSSREGSFSIKHGLSRMSGNARTPPSEEERVAACKKSSLPAFIK